MSAGESCRPIEARADDQRKTLTNMSNTETQKRPGLGIIGPVRLSYLSAFKPRANHMKGADEYSAVLLIPKEPNAFCPDPKAVGKAANALIKEALEAKLGANVAKWDSPLKDGDTETDNEGNPRNPGHWYIGVSAKADYPPLLIDCDRNPVTSGWQSGDWGKVQIQFYGYEFQGRKGVGAGLRGIQFLKHDEPLGGGGGASPDDFDAEQGDRSATAGEGAADPFADE